MGYNARCFGMIRPDSCLHGKKTDFARDGWNKAELVSVNMCEELPIAGRKRPAAALCG
jgi:hypothetical protein